MWSHYADRHEGICLGFEIPKELLSKVSYQNDRLPYQSDIFDSDPESAAEVMLKLATTNSQHGHTRTNGGFSPI